MKICSPMPTGSGAIVVHRQLEKHLQGYKIKAFSPKYEYFPFLIRQFSDKNANIIHTTPDYAFFHSRKNQKLLVTLHNYVLDENMQAYSSAIQRIHYKTDLRILTKLALEKAHTITAVSQFVADITKKDMGFEGEIKVIPNGIDEQLFKPLSKNKNENKRIKVLFSGNLSKRKGAQWIIPILDKLDSNIDIYYTTGIRGGEELSQHSRLQCIGSVSYDDMPKLYQSMDMLLMPTVREGLSLSILEAMSCGLPVVATNCSSLPEQVHHGKGGFLIAKGDVEEFSKRINYLASSFLYRVKMGEYNRQLIENKFSLKRMVHEYRLVLEKMMINP